MDEVKFVLKGLVVATVLTILLQLRVGGETLEIKSDRWIHSSSVGVFLNQTAEGASLAIRRAALAVKELMGTSFGHSAKNAEKPARMAVPAVSQASVTGTSD